MVQGLSGPVTYVFKNGVTFELDGQIFQVIEFQHVKPGKGAAFVRTKLKNIVTGATNPTDKMPKAHIERKEYRNLFWAKTKSVMLSSL